MSLEGYAQAIGAALAAPLLMAGLLLLLIAVFVYWDQMY